MVVPNRNVILNSDDRVTVAQVKQTFFDNVICFTDPTFDRKVRRMVGHCETLGSYDNLEAGKLGVQPVRMWIPETAADDYNLVLSICDDGMQRPIVDVDKPTFSLPVTDPNPRLLTPSTSNWAMWHTGSAQSFETLMSVYNSNTYGNAGYRAQIARYGYATLRPPWVNKGHVMDDTHTMVREHFIGFPDGAFNKKFYDDPKDLTTGWDDLFGDDDDVR